MYYINIILFIYFYLSLKGTAKIPANILKLPKGTTIETVNENNFELIKAYDQQFQSINRSDVLRMTLLKPPIRRSMIAIRNGKCMGYIGIRHSDCSWNRICPLIADDISIAENLLHDVIADFKLEGHQLHIFIPGENKKQAVPLLENYGIDTFQNVITMMATDIEKGKVLLDAIPWRKLFGLLYGYGTII